jgi:REP element-mobilizing transposase RayT
MSRPIRLEYPGAVFHVTTRGNERRPVFLGDTDRRTYLDLLADAVRRFEWIVPAYVLMTNHIHLVLQLTAENLSRGMQWLTGTYSQAFNRRHERTGHLFQGRFHAVHVDASNYMLEVLRYVVLNPVRAGIVDRPEEYGWSSYRSTGGLARVPHWLAADDVLALFATDRETAQLRYRDFVGAGIGQQRTPWDDVVGQIYLGSRDWVERIRTRVDLKPRADAHPAVQRNAGRRSMSEVIASVATGLGIDELWIRGGRGGVARMVAAWLGCYQARLPLRSIAAGLRLGSAGHTSALIRRCEKRLAEDQSLRTSIDRCTEVLYRMWKSDETKL